MKRPLLYVLLILLVPAILTSYFLHSALWLVVIPLGVIAFAVFVAALPGHKRIITPEKFADELERYLLGIEDKWDRDDTTSLAIADERLEQIRWGLSKFDSMAREKDKEDLKAIISALRRGDLPEVVTPTHLTYRSR
ncbi:MAG TPA: hypothetical protein VMV59_11905 [Candidatus Dormibacteraeota bacterium]|nr:hypothetical protein [Candidatus Dormibacteraeota bacterium]